MASAVLTLIVAVLLLADFAARRVAEGIVRDHVADALGLPAGTELSVDFGPGSFIAQVLSGRIDTVTVSAAATSVGELAGDLEIVAKGVPLDVNQPLASLTVRLALAADQLESFRALGGTVPIESIALAESSVVVSSHVPLFGAPVSVVVSLEPSVADGQLILTATDVSVGGVEFSLKAAENGPFSALVQPLLSPQTLCLAQYVPQTLTLDTAAVVDKILVLDFAAQNVALSDGGVTALGACE